MFILNRKENLMGIEYAIISDTYNDSEELLVEDCGTPYGVCSKSGEEIPVDEIHISTKKGGEIKGAKLPKNWVKFTLEEKEEFIAEKTGKKWDDQWILPTASGGIRFKNKLPEELGTETQVRQRPANDRSNHVVVKKTFADERMAIITKAVNGKEELSPDEFEMVIPIILSPEKEIRVRAFHRDIGPKQAVDPSKLDKNGLSLFLSAANYKAKGGQQLSNEMQARYRAEETAAILERVDDEMLAAKFRRIGGHAAIPLSWSQEGLDWKTELATKAEKILKEEAQHGDAGIAVPARIKLKMLSAEGREKQNLALELAKVQGFEASPGEIGSSNGKGRNSGSLVFPENPNGCFTLEGPKCSFLRLSEECYELALELAPKEFSVVRARSGKVFLFATDKTNTPRWKGRCFDVTRAFLETIALFEEGEIVKESETEAKEREVIEASVVNETTSEDFLDNMIDVIIEQGRMSEEEIEAIKKANPGDEIAALADVLEKRK